MKKSGVVLQDGFEVVATGRLKSELKNALYYHLQKFGIDCLLDQSLIINHNFFNKKAKSIILNLSLDNASNIFQNHQEGYNLYERHIRIDEFFYKHNAKLAQWHYTETYTKANAKDIIVHLYFNYSKEIGAPTWRYENNGVKSPEEALNLSVKDLLYKNSRTALKVMAKLFESVKNEHSRLEEVYTQQSTNLSQIEQITSLSDSQRKQAVEECRQTANELQTYYEDVMDCRFGLLEKRINNILVACSQAKVESPIAKCNDFEQADLLVLSDKMHKLAVTKAPNDNNQEDFNQKIEKIKERVRSLIGEIRSAQDIKTMLALEDKKNQLKDELLVAYFEADKVKSSCKNAIQVLDNMLSDKSCSLVEKFKDAAMAGGFELVAALYPHLSGVIPSSFYLELIFSYARPEEDKSNIEDKVKICEFLYENSVIYRQLVASINTIAKGYYDDNNNGLVICSILHGLVVSNNFPLFKTFVSQGGNPNIIAVVKEQNIVSLLDYTATFADHRFFNYLLEQGAEIDAVFDIKGKVDLSNPNQKNKPSWVSKDLLAANAGLNLSALLEKEKAAVKKLGYKQDNQSDVKIKDKYIKEFDFTLHAYLSAKNSEIAVVDKIAQKTSFHNLLLMLAILTDSSSVSSIVFPSKNKLGVEAHKTSQERKERALGVEWVDANYISCVVGSDQDDAMFPILQIITRELKKCNSTLEFNSLQFNTHDYFDKLTEQCLSSGEYSSALKAKRAKLYMLCYALPTIENHQEILQTILELKGLCKEHIKTKTSEQVIRSYDIMLAHFLNHSKFKAAFTEASVKQSPMF